MPQNEEENTLIRPATSLTRKTGRLLLALFVISALSAGVVEAQPSGDLSFDFDATSQAGPKKHQKRQGRPIKMGTSGGNVNDFVIVPPFISCCSGTLGALVEKNGEYYILSNNHVLAQLNQAQVGDPINQPGMLDNACDAPSNDFIAELSGYKKIKVNGNNKVDAALAKINDGDVNIDGEILEIGPPGNSTVAPAVGMKVKKSGRTTGRTKGEITAINVAGNVGFPEECSDEAPVLFIRFIKQMVIESTGNKEFSAGGDSGSLIVEDVDDCPRPVGLLFAGGPGFTIANKASTVLKNMKKVKPKGKTTFVGCDASDVAASRESLTIERGIPELDTKTIRIAERIQRRSEGDMLDLAGVHAMGIGRSNTDPSEAVFKVFLDTTRPNDRAAVPAEIDGVKVEVVETPQWKALSCPTPVTSAVASAN